MTIHFHNARLICPETGTDAPGSLTVDAGSILARDADAPEGATVIDCNGACLAPGIVDWGVKIGGRVGGGGGAGGPNAAPAPPPPPPSTRRKRWSSSPAARRNRWCASAIWRH